MDEAIRTLMPKCGNAEWKIYCAIHLKSKEGKEDIDYPTLMAMTGINSVTTISRGITALSEKGVLDIVRGGGNAKKNIYEVKDEAIH